MRRSFEERRRIPERKHGRRNQSDSRGVVPAMLMGAMIVLLAATSIAAAQSARDRRPPRIVAAAMLDIDRDTHADRLRVTYSERVRHAADRDGRYPFAVSGYRILSVGAAAGRSLVLAVVEKTASDHRARPLLRYVRTRSKPVRDRAGNQAVAQRFARVRPHGNGPAPPPAPAPRPQPPPPVLDTDRDGWDNSVDCAPTNAAIHPSAADVPDLAFVDSNCDRIDGTEANAIFASPQGSDTNPGTKARPKREIQAAVDAAAATGRYVLAAGGSYGHVTLMNSIGIYGGYDAQGWTTRTPATTLIAGSPEGIRVGGGAEVVLQLLNVRSLDAPSVSTDLRSTYGIRAMESRVKLERVGVVSGQAAEGPPGAAGRPGRNGGRGGAPAYAGPYCDWVDTSFIDLGGDGGDSPVGRTGGKGGRQGAGTNGGTGGTGRVGTPGGAGGRAGDPGAPGADGRRGSDGAPGLGGDGAPFSLALAGPAWVGRNGGFGRVGDGGNGGGGGGGGGGQTGAFVRDGTGNPGGGGGGGGAPGLPGDGGGYGGGSFGVYLYNATLVSEASTIAAGGGGRGGRGGDGGAGGTGGAGGPGDDACLSEVGRGGNGGRGGDGGVGGRGGGGAGGPSIGVFKVGTSDATLTNTTVNFGSAGAGGPPGAGGSAGATPSGSGIAFAVYP